MTSASAGTSRNVLMKYWLQRMGRGLYSRLRVAVAASRGAGYTVARLTTPRSRDRETYTSPMSRILKFDRTPVARLISCAASFASAALLFDYLSKGEKEIEALPIMALILLFLGTLAAAAVQYGDHIYLSDDGLMYENWVLKQFGRRGKWMRWEDIVEVREIKRKVLILFSRDGRRMLVDAILGYAIAKNEIVKRAPQAIFSGTLAQEESLKAVGNTRVGSSP